ncbi:phage tail tape measure protein [Hyphococcus formosus]|uniref:phage tail tape measure protein n=1 Tax=Hyphococcus formosus TaxID=3143534 RepID=UPI00398BA76D
MAETINVNVDTSGITEAGLEIERLARDQIAPAAMLIEDAFAVAARSIQSNLARAAERGELSLKKLAQALLRDLRGFAIDSLVRQPVHNLVSNALTGAFGGARANGGPVATGQAYLVGERGPEWFTPTQGGIVQPMGRAGGVGGVNVNITLPSVTDTDSFRRSETQIASALARAVARGQRNA